MLNSIKRWRSLWHPERYHGWGRKKSYFEGWYYKIVSADESLAMALIPGISMNDRGEQHAFIQMIDGTQSKSYNDVFPIAAFETDPDRFQVSIGDNHFSKEGLEVSLPHIQGDVRIAHTQSWPSSWGAPGVMGWYSFVPAMQCYHGVVSLFHQLEGSLIYNDVEYNFD